MESGSVWAASASLSRRINCQDVVIQLQFVACGKQFEAKAPFSRTPYWMDSLTVQQPEVAHTAEARIHTAQGSIPGQQNFRCRISSSHAFRDQKGIERVTNGVGKFGALGLIEIFILGGLVNAEIIATVLGAR